MSNSNSSTAIEQNGLLAAVKNETTAELYLSDTSAKQFVNDVHELIKIHADRDAIRQAIEFLQKFV